MTDITKFTRAEILKRAHHLADLMAANGTPSDAAVLRAALGLSERAADLLAELDSSPPHMRAQFHAFAKCYLPPWGSLMPGHAARWALAEGAWYAALMAVKALLTTPDAQASN